jgi:putative addiction module killer protein
MAEQPIVVQECLDATGRSPFARWFDSLNAVAASRVAVALYRLAEGNFSNVQGVGTGLYELKVDFGPGYRIYFGRDGKHTVVLLGGSTKRHQSAAIAAAAHTWAAYRRGKIGT